MRELEGSLRGLDGRVPQALCFGQRLEPLERVVLDLPDALAGDAERATDLLERARLGAREAEAQLDHLPLALGQRGEHRGLDAGVRGDGREAAMHGLDRALAAEAAGGGRHDQAPRSIQSYNAIGDAIDLAVKLFDVCPCQPTRRIIDVSGDNPDNRSHHPAPLARDMAVADGIPINALAIVQDGRLGVEGKPWLVETYERTVIGGFAAFAIAANTRADFARALREKMVLEISGLAPEPRRDLAAEID